MNKLSTLNFEEIYQDMFNTIYHYGSWTSDKVRTKYKDGTPAIRKRFIGYQFRFDNSTDVVPLVRSRFIPTLDAIRELYWIWIQRSNKVQDLRDLGCKYWNQWEKSNGTIGLAYGYQLNKNTFESSNQLSYIIDQIKNNPDSSRILTEMWNVNDLKFMSLTPCIHLTQWSVIDGKIVLEVRARSQDFSLGMCANVYQYSILHKVVALECNLQCGDFIYTIHDLHYYDRHESKLLEQFDNYNNLVEKPMLATVKINNFTNINEFKPSDIELISDNKKLIKINYEIAI